MEGQNDPELSEQITGLTSEVRKLRLLLERLRLDQYIRTLMSTRRLMLINFLTGIMSGLGGAIGATLVLTLLIYVLGRLEWIPVVGRWITEILNVVHRKGA